VRSKNISVRLQKNSINILSDELLTALVTEMPEAATEELVAAIKSEFRERFKREFEVADASMAVEIWGHVFAGKFANAVKAIAHLKFVDELAEKICLHCEVINIGEKDHDSNRFFWDSIAPFKNILASLMLREE
jgi:hypothetical protein